MVTTLRSFLAAARTALTAPVAERSLPLTFVVGNESADLDTLCSTLVLAYLRSNARSGALHIPLSNLSRSDLPSRTEMTAVLGRAGLTPSDLLTLSELPETLSPEDTRWLLVDHNALTGSLTKFSGHVTGCIDHHVDEGTVPHDAQPRVIEACGSCMSLVIEQSKGIWEDLSSREADAAAEQAELAQICLAPILVDTSSLMNEDKVTEKDRTAVTFLEQKLQGVSGYDRTGYYNELSALKEDFSKLSLRDIFRKDYKEWSEAGLNLGVSSIVKDLDCLIDEKASGSADVFLDEIKSWANERSLDVVALMTTSHRGDEFQRHLFAWGQSAGGVAAVRELESSCAADLELETYAAGRLDGGPDRRAWRQHKLTASRKQVAPLMRDALKRASESADPAPAVATPLKGRM